jgi:LmbE family N-acetylglucosaminyl deacetylase
MMRAGDLLQRMQALPFAEVDAIAPGTSLILAPHPDDESLGCGGLIASLCAHTRPPLIVVVTDGAGSHPDSTLFPPRRLRVLRKAEVQAAASILGVEEPRVRCLGLRDTAAPRAGASFDRAVEDIAAVVRAHGVTTIFATWPHDPHGDHQATAAIARAVADMTGARAKFYPVWGWLLPPDQAMPDDAISGERLDITPVLARKRRAIAAHASQYSNLIPDDPGFRLPQELLAACRRSFEVFVDP